MKKRMFFGFIIFFAASLFGEYKLHPDVNTLWIEDGKKIEVSPTFCRKGWLNKDFEVKELPDGKGFRMTPPTYKKHSGGRNVLFKNEYPYLVYEISGIHVNNKYLNETVWFSKRVYFSVVANMQQGIFVTKIEDEKDGIKNLRIDVFGHGVDFKYIKMVKTPDQYIVVDAPDKEIKPGDKIKFTTYLKEPAEDVTLRFFDGYCMPQLKLNDMDKLQLKPVDEDGKIWSAEIILKQLGSKKEYKSRGVLMKAVILGGNVPEPVWSPLPYKYVKE